MNKPLIFQKSVRVAAIFFTVLSVGVGNAFAQTVSSALGNADTEIRSSFTPVSRIMYAVMAIIGVVGAISVYGKWSAGDPDTRKSAASWFGALIFAGLVLLVLKAVFGVS
ncbi:uncharacterized protein DUF4134 [Spirosoma oryzae]|uniref:Uncharacterized protein DUF4134 n=1 Tax=Spirosoma oryzae TaxID=1469603 RepID=A0A2T0S3C1_9BACT|nr:DUF4134 domain-containing protein [Spirosoma oryzae]PRY27813.1 uncharacterized protein DUF4134 [Spirosoma oryzae]